MHLWIPQHCRSPIDCYTSHVDQHANRQAHKHQGMAQIQRLSQCRSSICARDSHAARGNARLTCARAAPVKETPPTVQQSSPAVEILGLREVSFLNDRGEIEEIDVNVDDHSRRTIVQRFKTFTSDLLLPDGYPETLTPDYLPYQLWALPVHVTGWISNSLVTSSLLKAAGLGSGAAGTVAAGAAIKWITKDGIGALGRVLVGSSLARYFDEDPRFWRLVADFIKAGGQALEVATAASPSLFILLAGTGNFAKAAGKGISRPAFRVIQNHFATRGNVGDVAAREEIWEVIGQLIGLASSVALLQALDSATASGTDAATTVIGTWATVQGAHLVLRWKSLTTLELPWISQRRASMLSAAFVRGEPLPDVRTTCRAEQFAYPKQFQPPYILMNATLAQTASAAADLPFTKATSTGRADRSRAENRSSDGTTGSNGNGGVAGAEADDRPETALIAALDLYRDAEYVLLPVLPSGEGPQGRATGAAQSNSNGNGSEGVSVDRSAGAASAAEGAEGGNATAGASAGDAGNVMEAESFVMAVKAGCNERGVGKLLGVLQAEWFWAHRAEFPEGPEGGLDALCASLRWAQAEAPRFEDELREAGWDVERVVMWSRQRCVIAVGRPM